MVNKKYRNKKAEKACKINVYIYKSEMNRIHANIYLLRLCQFMWPMQGY
jgi:hypothetical protein